MSRDRSKQSIRPFGFEVFATHFYLSSFFPNAKFNFLAVFILEIMANEAAEVDVHLLDAEFNSYLQIARELMKKMRLAEDRRVADKYIRSCLLMEQSEQLKVKAHRNRFFRYLLKTMKRTVETTQGSVYLDLVS